MIKVLDITQSDILPQIWTIEVLGQKRDDILILKDLFDDHCEYSGLFCKGIKFNEDFPSFNEIGAKVLIKNHTDFNTEDCKNYILKILNILIS